MWITLLSLTGVYYVYVLGVLLSKKKDNKIKDDKNDAYLQINSKFVNDSLSEHEKTDLETILSQVDEVENNSELLEVFKKGSTSEKNTYSLTHEKNEKFKIIRSEDSANKKDSDSGT